ncbi:MAG TPA: hypothetical protein DCE41_14560 [Cytophagales bacterium]|nr:hypothetical protein [Cytophagales bacterium]HAA17886.1 hypothetical protein [Cytophagales bacterium]
MPVTLDSVEVCFQLLINQLQTPFQLHQWSEYDSSALFAPDEEFIPKSFLTQQVFGDSPNLKPEGFLSRSLAVGNQQNIFLNSRFQLEVEGNLSDDLSMSAVLRDSQFPFQPEGNTQQIREFDRVYLGLNHKKGIRVAAGDIEIMPLEGRFLQYQKQVMGLQGVYQPGHSSSYLEIAAGQGRGRFTSQWLPLQEGLAGPYRLLGDNGESNIQILAGSERVYLEGKQLTRGWDGDYIIDFNTAEITFTPQVQVTSALPIRIEYEYVDRSYPRVIVAGKASQNVGNWTLWAQAYRHQDDALRPFAFSLTPSLQGALSEPSSTGILQVPAQDSVGFSQGALIYAKKDTLVSGEVYAFYQYSQAPADAHWQVSFSYVGNGQGDYVLAQSLPQGRVYTWVPPVDGTSQGNYAAVIEVPLPEKRQIVSAGGRMTNNGHQFDIEMATSDYVGNLYLPDSKMQAFAGWLAYQSATKEVFQYDWSVSTNVESRQSQFQEVERYRSVEFDRFWRGQKGIDSLLGSYDHWGKIRIEGRKDAHRYVWAEQGGRYAGVNVNGWEQAFGIGQQWGAWQGTGKMYLLNGRLGESISRWRNHTWEVVRRGKKMQPGYRFREEFQAFENLNRGSLLGSNMNWQQHEVFVQSGDSTIGTWKVAYTYRIDKTPASQEWIHDSETQAVAVNWDPITSTTYGLNLVGQYRRLKTFGLEREVQPFLNGQVRGYWEPYAGFRIQGGYATQTSRELRREFVYLPVPLGQGTHTWQDLNNDGLQSLDEFLEAIYFNEKEYARFFVPTTDYIPAQGHNGDLTLSLASPKSWRTGTMVQRLISRFSFSGRMEYRHKADIASLDMPLSKVVQHMYTVYINRGGLKWGLETGYLGQESLQQLSQGPESFLNGHYFTEGRWSLNSSNSLVVRYEKGNRSRIADFWEGQSWQLIHHQWKPEWRWVLNKQWRLVGNYRWQNTQEAQLPSHFARINEVQAQLQWQPQEAAQSLRGHISYISLHYNGEDLGQPISYRMLEGLQPGSNWRIGCDWTQTMPNGLQLIFFYDARNVSGTGWIHSGNAQVAWVF